MPLVTNQLSEKELLFNVAAGDQDAFRRLFELWYPFLDTHIYRITRLKPLTQEIVQDVFLKIWNTRETLTGVRHFRSYLLVVSRNHALNALQKIAREYAQMQRWVAEQQPESGDPDARATCYSLIDEAIDQLSPRQKEIYLLHRHQRLTYHQVAAQLGIGRETVKYHLEKATEAISRYVNDRLSTAIMLASVVYVSTT